MKILVIHSADNKDERTVSQVDIWRIWRPVRELRNHVDWDITERQSIIKNIGKYKTSADFTEEEMNASYEELKQYDIIYGSYTSFMNPMVFSLCMVLQQKEGVKLVLDVDDNVFHINEDNVGWWLKMSHEQTFQLQQIVKNVSYIITTNPILAGVMHERNPNAKIGIVPNYISKDYEASVPQNKRLRIGYFGGASHYKDLHETGVLEAIEKLMHEYRNIEFETAGIYSEKYLPKARYTYNPGKRGHAWHTEVFPKLQYDICLAPLKENQFNVCKTAIKWQEAAMMHAPTVASNIPPYRGTIRHNKDGLLVANDQGEWYAAIKQLIDDEALRKELANNAETRVRKDMLIENNWTDLKQALEIIHEDNFTGKKSIILQA